MGCLHVLPNRSLLLLNLLYFPIGIVQPGRDATARCVSSEVVGRHANSVHFRKHTGFELAAESRPHSRALLRLRINRNGLSLSRRTSSCFSLTRWGFCERAPYRDECQCNLSSKKVYGRDPSIDEARRFVAVLWPNLAPGTPRDGPALKIVQIAPTIGTGNQL